MTSSKGRVFTLGPAATFTKETILKMKGMETVRCSGLMVRYTRVNGSKVFKMALAESCSLMDNLRKAFSKTISISIL